MKQARGFLALLLFIGIVAGVPTRYDLCMGNSVCRDRYLQSASVEPEAMSQIRFEREMIGITSRMSLLVGNQSETMENDDKMQLYEMILHKVVFDEDRCPPNSFWRWSQVDNRGECQCYIDRDCRATVTAVCHDTTHPAVFILGFIFVILIVLDIVVRIVTDRYTK